MEDFHKRTFLNAGIILSSFTVAFLAIYFLNSLIHAKGLDVAADRRTIAERTYALENLSELKNRIPEAEIYKKKISLLLPAQDSLISFPQFLEGTGRVYGVSLTFAFSAPPLTPQTGQAGQAPFSAVVSGTAANIASFIDDLEFKSTKFLIALESVNVTADGSGGYRADIKGNVYFR